MYVAAQNWRGTYHPGSGCHAQLRALQVFRLVLPAWRLSSLPVLPDYLPFVPLCPCLLPAFAAWLHPAAEPSFRPAPAWPLPDALLVAWRLHAALARKPNPSRQEPAKEPKFLTID